MPLPTIESIKTTIENHYATNIHDSKLNGYKPIPGLLGPMFYPGGFGVVFPLENSNGHKYAFRVWHKEIQGIKDRTNKIANYLKNLSLPYFVEFDYVQGGLTVEEDDGLQTVDTVRMEWIEGANLHDFISNSKENDSEQDFKQKMRELAVNFKKMFKDLHQVGISHGDLQHGNVVIKDDLSIKLVDYDSVYVPSINGEVQITSGLTGYQHPVRKTNCSIASDVDDYFSELIIYSGLLALSLKPELWPDDEEEIDNFSFLFTEKDFESIINSTKGVVKCSEGDLKAVSCPLFQQLVSISSPDPIERMVISDLNKLLILLVDYLNETNLSLLKPIPGTAKSKIKQKYKEQDVIQTNIDVDSLKDLLGDLGANKKTGYSGKSYPKPIVSINKTDADSRQDKYLNQ